ncbi:MAG: ATP-binding protein [Sphingobacteriales bacterium]|nr:MAG: ATP-binding protein [Sphingobacteriales bacterium]
MNLLKLGIKVGSLFAEEILPPFTPNEPEPNHLYAERNDLEKSAAEGLRTKRFIAISGVSGSGKTWLVKEVLKKTFFEQIPVRIAQGMSLRDSLLNSMKIAYTAKQSVSEDKKSLSFEGLMKSSFESNKSTTFDITKVDVVQIMNNFFRKTELDHVAFKFDNIEDADLEILIELKDLIKGDDFLDKGIKFIFVGATNTESNFDALLEDAAVLRRGKILSNIRGLNDKEIEKIFEIALGEIPQLQKWAIECWDVTNGISAYVHEYGNSLFNSIQDKTLAEVKADENLSPDEILERDAKNKEIVLRRWLKDSGNVVVKMVKESLNAGRGRRRDQIMFVMANSNVSLFRESDLKALIVDAKLYEAENAQLNQPLSELVTNKILFRVNGRYEFYESRMKGVLRVCLRLKPDDPSNLNWIEEV